MAFWRQEQPRAFGRKAEASVQNTPEEQFARLMRLGDNQLSGSLRQAQQIQSHIQAGEGVADDAARLDELFENVNERLTSIGQGYKQLTRQEFDALIASAAY